MVKIKYVAKINMKKLLVIHNKYQNIGGEDIAVQNEIEFLENNYQVEVLYYQNKISNYLNDLITFLTTKNKNSLSLLKNKIDSFKYILANTSNILKTITLILFNHDSKYRNKRFLVPKLINAFKQKNIKYIQKIYYENISGDFSHAEDICNGIFKLSLTNSNIEKIILSPIFRVSTL